MVIDQTNLYIGIYQADGGEGGGVGGVRAKHFCEGAGRGYGTD